MWSPQNLQIDQATTRAVVIGISDYQNIPDLKYAHRDAEAFAGWLQSPAGGNLSSEHIQIWLNEKATSGNVIMSLTWLYEQCKEGDRAIIYFSGHGDVEKKLFSQPGYLLCWNAPDVVYASGGSLAVTYLQEIVKTLTLVNKSNVLLITDACRAGKLAGSEFGGAQATTAALQERFANEIKILSCQPSEFSIEGEQWGGGMGAFSYHLVDGLYGFADKDKDLQIKLKEIGRYLEDRVPVETDPQVQNPIYIGDREALVAFVEEGVFAQRKEEKEREQPGFFPGDMRGMEEIIIAQADSNIQKIYLAYIAAIESGELMSPEGKSANDYYKILIKEPDIEQIHGFLKRNFVAALIDEAQQVTNNLLKTDPNVVSDIWSRPFVYDHISAYLERASEILGKDHFIYKQLKAKQYYFESLYYRQDNFPDMASDSLMKIHVNKLEEALEYDSLASYIYVYLSFAYYFELHEGDKAIFYSQKALEFSPNWVFAQYAAGTSYGFTDQSKGIYHLQKALELDSTFFAIYQELSQIYWIMGNPEKRNYFSRKYVQKFQAFLDSNPDKVPAIYLVFMGSELYKLGRYSEAKKALNEAERLTNQQWVGVYQWLAIVYLVMCEYENTKKAILKQIELSPSSEGYMQLGSFYFIINQPLKAEMAYKQLISTAPNSSINHYVLGQLYHYDLKRFDEAEKAYLKALFLDSTSLWVGISNNLELGNLYLELGRPEEAKILFQKIIDRYAQLVLSENTSSLLYTVGRAYDELGKEESMNRMINEAAKLYPDNPEVLLQIVRLYAFRGKDKEALVWLERAFEKGFTFLQMIYYYHDMDKLRKTKEFETLVKKYFPDWCSGNGND